MGLCFFCQKETEIPFQCPFCNNYYCEEHRLPENHQCVQLPEREWDTFSKIKNLREGYGWGLDKPPQDFLQPEPEQETFETYFRRDELDKTPQKITKRIKQKEESKLGKIIIGLIIISGLIIILYELGVFF